MSSTGRGKRGRAILLTGMMGSGKSRVGSRLASQLGWDFVDTDAQIEARAGQPVAEIFATHGEARFRELERSVLRDLPAERTVVALGGGAVVAPENRELLRAKGLLVWLDASPECLAERMSDTRNRPLLAGATGSERIARLRELLDQRREAYASADVHVVTNDLSLDESTEKLLRAVRQETAA